VVALCVPLRSAARVGHDTHCDQAGLAGALEARGEPARLTP
jgi:hypothetical protein